MVKKELKIVIEDTATEKSSETDSAIMRSLMNLKALRKARLARQPKSS